MRGSMLVLAALAGSASVAMATTLAKKHHHKKHKSKKQEPAPAAEAGSAAPPPPPAAPGQVMQAIKGMQDKLNDAEEAHLTQDSLAIGSIDVNGPLPTNFDALFASAVGKSIPLCKEDTVKIEQNQIVKKSVELLQTKKNDVIVEVTFSAPQNCVDAVLVQAADPDAPLTNGVLHDFLVAEAPVATDNEEDSVEPEVDTDVDMPFGELEPFGREDTAHELTADSIDESDAMVDQMEKAEVAEEKRSVFRALTRLRGAAITSFDGVARSQTNNIDEYNKAHHWRKTHPLHHLATEESDVSKWAFPSRAD